MHYVKKLIFVIPFLANLTGFIYYLNPLLGSLDLLFAFNLNTIIQVLTMVVLLLLSGVFFVIFATLANDIKLVIPASLICSIIPPIITNNPYPLYLSPGLFISQVLAYLVLKQKLSAYLTFSAHTLLNPSVKHFTTLILLAASIVFYLSISAGIKQNGFKLPDSLLDLSIDLATQQSTKGQDTDNSDSQTLPQIPPEQLQLLKNNPQLLKQYGLDPSILDQIPLNTSNTSKQAELDTSQLIKPMLENQFQGMIKPFENWIAPVLSLLFFITLVSISSLLSLFITPLMWILFWMMEKTRFAIFTTEMREVKKLVV